MKKTLLLVGALSLFNCQDKAQNISTSSLTSSQVLKEIDSTQEYKQQDSLTLKNPVSESLKTSDGVVDQQEIQTLIRQVLKWANSDGAIELLPVVADRNNHAYVGVNMSQHKQNLNKLKATNFFAQEFIENFDRIILTLDKRLKKGGENEWLVGDMAPFSFVGVNPWCNCQDVPYDRPNPWNEVKVEVINLQSDKGELVWKWAKTGQEWGKYRFKVVKENDVWKIAYLEGFDFKTSTK